LNGFNWVSLTLNCSNPFDIVVNKGSRDRVKLGKHRCQLYAMYFQWGNWTNQWYGVDSMELNDYSLIHVHSFKFYIWIGTIRPIYGDAQLGNKTNKRISEVEWFQLSFIHLIVQSIWHSCEFNVIKKETMMVHGFNSMQSKTDSFIQVISA